jgi:hypothetical protein
VQGGFEHGVQGHAPFFGLGDELKIQRSKL